MTPKRLLRRVRACTICQAALPLGARPASRLAASARREYAPQFLPPPHPRRRRVAWMRRNPWFEATATPELRRIVRTATRR